MSSPRLNAIRKAWQAHRFGEYGVPFLYSTNGEVIWHHDIRYVLESLATNSSFSYSRSFKRDA